MHEMTNVIIAIQARSNSQRLPRKVFQMIGDKTILQHVIDACERAAGYLNKHTFKSRVAVKVCLLIPEYDEIKDAVGRAVTVIEGPELDVLTRFKLGADKLNADYIVRVTADCPLLPPYIISKHIKVATMNRYDYLSNVDTTSRTFVDGLDCEIMSFQALKWLDENAKDMSQREHVTTLLREKPPTFLRTGQFVSFIDHSDVKLSVDTIEDLQRVREMYKTVNSKVDLAIRLLGKNAVHRI